MSVTKGLSTYEIRIKIRQDRICTPGWKITILMRRGLIVEITSDFGGEMDFPYLKILYTLLWRVGKCEAYFIIRCRQSMRRWGKLAGIFTVISFFFRR